jgi:excisionase family DNA binding protein
MDTRVYSTYQVAAFCHVHHTSIIHWVNENKLKAYTTPGGHRRICEEDLVAFMKQYGIPMPEELKYRKRNHGKATHSSR